ncbi:MAG: hypothetical protein CL868_15425 [Cytophagaceae bacterium]|nr:hypothetical protein [Cytophagaceae bacterium]
MKPGQTIWAMLILIVVACTGFTSCSDEGEDEAPTPTNINYRQEMRTLVQDISAYAKGINPAFAVIPQNGAELVSSSGDDTGPPEMTYIHAIDAMGQEDLYYGYDRDDEATAGEDVEWLRSFLDMAKNNGTVKIMVTDYCSTPSKMEDSYIKNNASGYISFAASHRELDNVPTYPAPVYNENNAVVTSVQDAKNFLYLLAPDNESPTSQEFVNAVKNTNYDCIIMDYFYNGETFTATQLDELRHKANGGKRLLISYMSIGEAEDYRYYWQPSWATGHPAFLGSENPNWPGNFYVAYWQPEWKDIIYGNDDSYLKKILDAGFDGVYLDIIDAYERYEH